MKSTDFPDLLHFIYMQRYIYIYM